MKLKFYILSLFLIIIQTVILILSIKNFSSDNYFNLEKIKYINFSKSELALFHAELEFMKIRNPYTNSIPENARQKELEFSNNIPTRESLSQKSNNSILAQNWVSLGPRNISGRMLSIEFDINNENIILAGSASGGIWKSIDRGQSWFRTSSSEDLISVTSIAQDKRIGKQNIWYYGTGELLSTTDRRISTSIRTIGLGNGVYKSIDNGSSWTPLNSTRCVYNGWLSEIFQGIWTIKVDTRSINEDIVYAACYGAIMRSTDGGETWNKVLGDLDNKSFSTDIVLSENGNFYASLSSYTKSGKKPKQTGIWKSSNGIDWIDITPSEFSTDTRVIKLAAAPSNPNILYILTEVPQHSKSIMAFAPSYHGFWKYTENPASGDGSWEKRTTNLPGGGIDNYNLNCLNSLGAYALTFKVKPDDENVIFLGGTSLFRTTNGFTDTTSNKKIGGYPFDWTDKELHPDMHGIAFLPSNPNVLFVANDGGIQATDNCMNPSVNWSYLTNGLITTQFYSIAIDHNGNHDGLYFGGLQDNASQLLNSNDPYQPWKTIYGGDGMSCAINDNGEFIIGSTYYGSIFTTNKTGDVLVEQMPDTLNWSKFSFYTNFALDLDNSKTLYLPAKNQIWRKDDISISAFDTNYINKGWKEITSNEINSASYITSIKADSSRLYIGTNVGRVYRLDDPRTDNYKPYEITGTEFPFFGFVSCVEFDPDDPDKVFVVFSNYSVLSIFYSEDGGINWTKQGGNLEGNPELGTLGPSIRYIKILKFHGNTIYFAGTSTGLYSTNELAGSNTIWVKEASGTIGNSIVDYIDARSSDGLVVVATQGSGVFNTYYSTSENINSFKDSYFSLEQNFPNPASNFTEIKFTLNKPGYSRIKLYDMNGNMVKTVTEKYYHTLQNSVKLKVSDIKAGTYFYSLESGNRKQTKKMIVLQ
ncbi:MAG: T9SS type A sorting domain-containing protein [Ignavibacteriae bacterium]|nr:T9SS type A sorting domain-containing protein [Ignavibacteriota bacterium]